MNTADFYDLLNTNARKLPKGGPAPTKIIKYAECGEHFSKVASICKNLSNRDYS